MKAPTVGEVYYMVGFADADLKIPHVRPMLFLGQNLFPDDDEEPSFIYYYFRDPTMSPDGLEGEGEPTEYFRYEADRLSSFHTLIEAIAILSLVAAGVDLTRPPGSRGLDL
ncbi:MAG: hypothetical protein KDG52_07460 [Rhodocyclaceae bacterium]|nr:hypothetical protein [Rhodocyclaceae bacterium]